MEDREQQVETNSFFISDISAVPEPALREALACQHLKLYSWEFLGQKRRFAEVFYSSTGEAEQAYNQLAPLVVAGFSVKFLLKRAASTLWISGLPGIVYARDLFSGLQELTPGILRVHIPSHPE